SLALGAAGACIAFAGYTAARKSSDLLHAHSLFRDYLARRVDVQLAGAAADGDAWGFFITFKLYVLEEVYIWVRRRRSILPSDRESVKGWLKTIEFHLLTD